MTISYPDKPEHRMPFGLQRDSLITAGCFIQFGTAAGVEISLDAIQHPWTFNQKVKAFLDTAVVGYTGQVNVPFPLYLMDVHFLEKIGFPAFGGQDDILPLNAGRLANRI